MKLPTIFLINFGAAILGFSAVASDLSARSPDLATQYPGLLHETASGKGVLTNFMNAVSREEYNVAFSKLHSKISEAWTPQGFAKDWIAIRHQLSAIWKPEIVGTFTGQSPQGQYDQITYRLVSDWRSLASVDLTAMSVGGEPQIIQIYIRIPTTGSPSDEVRARTKAFVQAMLREDYNSVQAMFAADRRAQYQPGMLARLRPILGETREDTAFHYYRLNANSVWYDAVRLMSPNDPASYLDVIMESGSNSRQIIALMFKGRIRQ